MIHQLGNTIGRTLVLVLDQMTRTNNFEKQFQRVCIYIICWIP